VGHKPEKAKQITRNP